MDYCGYNFNEALEKLEDVSIYHGSADDYTYDMVQECYDLPEFALRYFDYDSLKRDMELNGEIIEMRHGQDTYTITNASGI